MSNKKKGDDFENSVHLLIEENFRMKFFKQYTVEIGFN